MIKNYNSTQLKPFTPVFEEVAWVNAPALDYNLLKNRGNSWVQYYAMDIFSSSWAAGDVTFRVIKLIWTNWDLETTYSQEIITWLGSTTAKITSVYNIATPISDTFSVLPWKIFEIYASFNTATQNLQVNTAGSKRYLFGSSTTITSANPNITIINTWTTDLSIQLKFATSAAERPIFWFLIKIY